MMQPPIVGRFIHALSKRTHSSRLATACNVLRLNIPRTNRVIAVHKPRTDVSQQSQILRWAYHVLTGSSSSFGQGSLGTNHVAHRDASAAAHVVGTVLLLFPYILRVRDQQAVEKYRIVGYKWQLLFVKDAARRICKPLDRTQLSVYNADDSDGSISPARGPSR